MRRFTASFLTLAPALAAAQPPAASAGECNAASREPVVHVPIDGNPFGVLPTRDGCTVFVSVPRGDDGRRGAIVVLQRSGGALTHVRTVSVDGSPGGMVLTRDEGTLIVAAQDRVVFLDARRLRDGGDALLGAHRDTTVRGRIYANVTSDDRWLFVAEERSQAISVIDLAKARASRFDVSSTVGKIPVGAAPIALTFGADERYLYTTSQIAPPSLGWPLTCIPANANPRPDRPTTPAGAIVVIDVRRATTDPARAIVAAVPGGCTPVRLVLSPRHDVAYVSARGENRLLAFDADRLVTDSARARLGAVPVGVAPVGVAVIDGGARVLVTSSNRFAGGADDRQYVYAVDARRVADGARAVVGRVAAGAFPREMRVTADGRTLLLTNYASSTVQMIDLARLPIEPVAP